MSRHWLATPAAEHGPATAVEDREPVMSSAVQVAPRGCGVRKLGAVYLEVDTAPDGQPIEAFLVDPPIAIDAGSLGITPKGVKVIDDGEAGVLIDWIGNRDYPNVADYIEEARRHGISRRLPSNLEFDQLTEDTRLLLVHAKACVLNSAAYWREVEAPWCPKDQAEHCDMRYRAQGGLCGAVWWDDITGGCESVLGDGLRAVVREMPAFSYLGRRCPDDVTPIYQLGVFMQHRISRLVVVRDPEGGRHDAVIDRVREADLPVVLVDA